MIDDVEADQNVNNASNKQVSDSQKKGGNKDGNTPAQGVKPSGAGVNSGIGADKISKKDKMHEVYILFKELDGKMRKQQAEVEELLKNLKDDQPCP